MTNVVASFTGTGKSFFTKKYPGMISDPDASAFDKQYFPSNYLAAIRNNIVNDKCSFVSCHDVVRDALVKNGISFILVFPAQECKEEYLSRFNKRGDELKYIDLVESNWDRWIAECKAQEGCTQIELKPGQFLEDVIGYDEAGKEFFIK